MEGSLAEPWVRTSGSSVPPSECPSATAVTDSWCSKYFSLSWLPSRFFSWQWPEREEFIDIPHKTAPLRHKVQKLVFWFSTYRLTVQFHKVAKTLLRKNKTRKPVLPLHKADHLKQLLIMYLDIYRELPMKENSGIFWQEVAQYLGNHCVLVAIPVSVPKAYFQWHWTMDHTQGLPAVWTSLDTIMLTVLTFKRKRANADWCGIAWLWSPGPAANSN